MSTNPSSSALTLSVSGTKNALEKFRGHYSQIKRFVKHYEKLCQQNNVTQDKELCENIFQYCSKKVAEFEALPSYNASDWKDLKQHLYRYFDADLYQQKHKLKDLVAYIKKCRH